MKRLPCKKPKISAMYFIEIYKSSYTGNTLYSRPKLSGENDCEINKALRQTAPSKYLKTIRVIKFDWCREKDGFFWYPGQRKLLPAIPLAYKAPSLWALTGKKPPKKKKPIDLSRELPKPVAEPYTAKVGELAFN